MQHQPSGVEIIMRETESDACVGPDGVLQVRGQRATCAGVWPADKEERWQHASTSPYGCTGPCCARETRRRASGSGAAVLLGVWQSLRKTNSLIAGMAPIFSSVSLSGSTSAAVADGHDLSPACHGTSSPRS